MFTSDFEKYLSNCPSREIINICEPLFKNSNIDHFLYLKLYSDGSRISLTTCNDLLRWIYQENKLISNSVSHINSGIYLAKDLINFVSYKDAKKIEAQIDGARNYFNLDLIENGIYLIKKEEHYCELFEFGAAACKKSLINFYLNNIDILKHFILYFKDKAKRLIKKLEQNRFQPTYLTGHLTATNNNFRLINANFFEATKLSGLSINQGSINTHLTKREYECLTFLVGGCSAKEIAKALHISPRSVEYHLENIKRKLNCHTKSALISKILRLQILNPSHLNWLLSTKH